MPITIDQDALDESIRTDSVLAEIASDRLEWRKRQDDKSSDWTAKIQAMRAECKPLLRAVRAAEALLRKQRGKIDRAIRKRRRNFKQLKVIDKRETARLRFLRGRAVEHATAEVRRQLLKEQKLTSMI